MPAPRLLALAALLLSASTTRADDTDTLRALVRLPYWTENIGFNWSGDGKIYLTGDTPLAREELTAAREAARKKPDNSDAQNTLYRLLTQIGDRAGAAAQLQDALTLCRAEVAKHPKNWEAHAALAAALAQAGDPRAAEASARRAVALAPDASGAWYALALLLKDTRRDEAARAIDKAAALAEDDDVVVQLTRAFLRLNDRQRRLDQLAAVADAAAIQGAMIAEARRDLRDADELLLKVAKLLKAADGMCGPDTRDRCLVVMTVRDTLRAKLRALLAAGRSEGELDPILSARTAKLIREIIPATSDDPARLFAAAFLLRLSAGDARAATGPYLRRLDELANAKSTARAATAVFLCGAVLRMRADYTAAAACYRRAVRLVPSFDLAWMGILEHLTVADPLREAACGALLGAVCQVRRFHALAVAREWVAQSGSTLARYMLAQAQTRAGDWPAAERIIADELKKHPDNPRLILARAACWLRSAATAEELVIVGRELQAANARLQEPGVATPELMREAYWLAALSYARCGEIAEGRRYAEAYAQWAEVKGEGENADVAALRRLLDHLAASPLPPLTSSGGSHQSFHAAELLQSGSGTAPRKRTPAPERR
jgi:tetratricopeptide (TPR) repeat protein